MNARRYACLRAVLGVAIVALLVALGVVQAASEVLNRDAAVEGTLPRRISTGFGVTVYRALDAIAPATYVEATLAQWALAHGDALAAQRYAVRMAASPTRDELLARVALARGQERLALEYFLAAPDPDSVYAVAAQLAARDPAASFALVQLLEVRLALLGTHPDEVAEAYWRMGRLANRQAWRQIPGSTNQRAWLVRGLAGFEMAVQLAPLSERYLIAAANQADLLGNRRRARELFQQAADADPASAEAIAGLGVVAWEEGNRKDSLVYLERARALDPAALMVHALERDLR